MARKQNVIVGLDLGSSKICAVVAEVLGEEVNIIGLGESFSTGLRRGIIVDLERTTHAVNEALNQAEQMSGVEIKAAYVGITGTHISVTNSRGVVAVTNATKEIGPDDVRRVLQAAKIVSLPSDREIVHVLPRQYVVDGYEGIIDPVGMAGARLEAETVIVSAAAAAVRNLMKSVQQAGVRVEELVLNPLAAAEAVLLPAEKELGTVFVDIGGGTTEVAIFDQGGLYFAGVLPLGGEYLTGDLAVGLRAPLSLAEELKKKYGVAMAAQASEEALLEVTELGGQGKRRVSKKLLASIIEPRLQELFSFVKQEIKRSGYRNLIPGGIVLSGGTAALEGIEQLAALTLDLPARVGKPVSLGGMFDLVNGPGYATAVGLVKYGMRNFAFREAAAAQETPFGGFWERIKAWWREFF